ncbi:MAG: hypothetical protein EZS28_037600 [Streblomastix strix]|uniref:Uncharacterized protein n=1 Tax=Streblomastix strix TaxID=222440 RepID=A0A5J4U9I3_9EUKA|nr:MAG: hypothetical protein EZS28_037600 [Streblomastix strix]
MSQPTTYSDAAIEEDNVLLNDVLALVNAADVDQGEDLQRDLAQLIVIFASTPESGKIMAQCEAVEKFVAHLSSGDLSPKHRVLINGILSLIASWSSINKPALQDEITLNSLVEMVFV